MNNIKIMYVLSFLQGLVFYGPAATIYRQARGLSIYDIFLIESIFMVLMIIFEIPFGWFADRYGYKKTMILSNFMLFISKIVFYYANSFSMFLIERILLALYSAGTSGCDTAFLYDCSDKKNSQRIFGMYGSMNTAAFVIASILFTFISSISLDFTAFASIFPCAAAFIVTFFIKDVNSSQHKNHALRITFKEVSCNKKILLLVVSFALVSESTHSIGVFLNQIQYIKSGISTKFFGIITAFVQLFSISAAFTYIITKKFGEKTTIEIVILKLSTLCIILACTSNAFLSIFLVAIIQGLFAIINPIVLDIENKSITATNRTTILSSYAIISDIVSSLINILIGIFAEISIESAFLSCAIIVFIALILFKKFFNKSHNGES